MNFYLTILGSGAALPTGRRRCSAQVVNVNGFKILLDCAEGTQDRIRYHHIKLQSLGTILISHLHGDHFFGLPGLLSTMHLCGRTEPVTIVAPRGAREVIETIFSLTGNHVDYELRFVEMDYAEGIHRVFDCPRCTVDAFPIVHSVPTYGFRITGLDDRHQTTTPNTCNLRHTTQSPIVYTYCCDTAYDETLVPYMQGSDLLCLESTFADDLVDLALQRQHLTAGQAGRLAALAAPRQLLLSHISARYKDPDLLLGQAKALFPNTLVAADGQVIELKTMKMKSEE
ncbi:MAG: ribonuclease Z [Bacteroidales bacterium]|nr:ribonuclease Z [Bacteroidales bacterium]